MIPVLGSTLAGAVEITLSVYDILKNSSYAIFLGNDRYPTPCDEIKLSAERIGYHAINMVTGGLFGWCFTVKCISNFLEDAAAETVRATYDPY